jgi:heme exporter protein D
MLSWLQNPHADYVIAAYGVVVVALVGLGVVSAFAAMRTQKVWHKLQSKNSD